MFNIAPDASTQLKVAKSIVEKWIDSNVGRAAGGASPLVYKEIIDIIR